MPAAAVDADRGVAEPIPVTLVTRNISSSGVYFLAPRELKPGMAIELEVALVERPLGFGRVEMCTAAHIVRTEQCDTPGWRGYAASFDDFALKRDDVFPCAISQPRLLRPTSAEAKVEERSLDSLQRPSPGGENCFARDGSVRQSSHQAW